MLPALRYVPPLVRRAVEGQPKRGECHEELSCSDRCNGAVLDPGCPVAGGADEVHAYALALETFTAPSVFSCPTKQSGTSALGWIWSARNVIFLGPGVGTSALMAAM